MTLRELAATLGCALHGGDPDLPIDAAAGLEQAGPHDVTFLENPKYAHKVTDTKAGAVLVASPIDGLRAAQLISSHPRLDFARALGLFYTPPRPAPGVHRLASVASSARIGANASIGPFAVIGERVVVGDNAVIQPHVVIYDDVVIGDDFYAHAHVVIRERCRIGHRVLLQNGVIIGGDGFGFVKRADGSHYKIPQTGIAVIDDDVEVQTLTSIDRATAGETRVRRGAKIDSLVQVAHACDVGEDNIICAQTGLAGSSILKDDVLLAGQVGVSGHLTINEGAIIYAQSGIGGDVPRGAIMSGSPAFDARDWRRAVAAFARLPELARALRRLADRVDALEAKK
jgi:UDP-3-O-[3-hydroxymyristoyl] glucosamine N-acyltransferase